MNSISHSYCLAVHDFFTPQPIKDADVYLLRMVLHDWSDKYCLRILRHIRASAGPSSRIMIVDNLIPYACLNESTKNIPGAEAPLLPEPLLPNGGYAGAVSYLVDMNMIEMCNGKERTLTQVQELLSQTGWEVESVVRGNAISTPKVIAVPV